MLAKFIARQTIKSNLKEEKANIILFYLYKSLIKKCYRSTFIQGSAYHLMLLLAEILITE